MIRLTQPIEIEVCHRYKKLYSIDGLQLTEDDDTSITFKTYAQMATYLGISRQALYNKIRVNMHLLDVLADQIKRKNDNR
ncbi:hypothetical protein [Psychroserpens luteus]|uniref:Uncharacterized protein n=1 Tax=Psychroserpens luteus TaxID=1434066 RepID=A0ABW5ZV72_9FLAO|nr:hypothetical protein [Psychroserpens luteus]